MLFKKRIDAGLAHVAVGGHLGNASIGIVEDIPGGFVNDWVAVGGFGIYHAIGNLPKETVQLSDSLFREGDLLAQICEEKLGFGGAGHFLQQIRMQQVGIMQ